MIRGHVTNDLVPLHDGLLDEERARAVREHLTRCARCREVDDAITFSRDLLSNLSGAEMREEDRAAARSIVLQYARRPSSKRQPWLRWTAVAAGVAAVAVVGWLMTPHVRFVAPPVDSRSIERIATIAEDMWTTGKGSVETKTSSIDAARLMVKRYAGAFPPLRPIANTNRRLIGISSSSADAVPFSTMVFEINRHPVVLTMAQSAKLADAPPTLPYAKRLELRRSGETRVFTWSASGDAYSLVVPPGVAVADACAICHEGSRSFPYIKRATQGL